MALSPLLPHRPGGRRGHAHRTTDRWGRSTRGPARVWALGRRAPRVSPPTTQLVRVGPRARPLPLPSGSLSLKLLEQDSARPGPPGNPVPADTWAVSPQPSAGQPQTEKRRDPPHGPEVRRCHRRSALKSLPTHTLDGTRPQVGDGPGRPAPAPTALPAPPRRPACVESHVPRLPSLPASGRSPLPEVALLLAGLRPPPVTSNSAPTTALPPPPGAGRCAASLRQVLPLPGPETLQARVLRSRSLWDLAPREDSARHQTLTPEKPPPQRPSPLSATSATLGSAKTHDGSAPFFLVIDVVVLVSAAAPTAGSSNPSRGRPGGAVAAAAAAAAAAATAAGAAPGTAGAAGGGRPAAGPDGSVRAGGRRRVAAQRADRAHLLLPAGARPAAGLGFLLALARVPLLPCPLAAAPHLPPRLPRRAAPARIPHAQVRLVRARAAC